MGNRILRDSEEPFFSVNHLFTCKGRRGRLDFFKIYCFWQIILKVLMYHLGLVLFIIFENSHVNFVVVASIVDLLFSYPLLCNVSKRMHDLDCSFKWSLWYLILSNLSFYNFFYINTYYDYERELLYFWTSNVLIAIGIFLGPFLVLVFKRGTIGSNQYGDEP